MSKTDFCLKKLLSTIRPLTFSFSGKRSREERDLWQNAVEMCVPQVQAGAALGEDSPWSAFLVFDFGSFLYYFYHWRIFVLRQGYHWTRSSLIPQDLLADEFQGSSGLCLSRARIIGPCYQTQLFMGILGTLSSGLHVYVWQKPPWPSHLPALSKCLNCIVLCSKQTLLVFFPSALEQLLP